LDDIFRSAPTLVSEDDCAENIVIPFLLRLGYQNAQIRRKVTITGINIKKFKKQADIIIYINGRAALIIETKKISHRLNEEDANQALSYAQLFTPPVPFAILTNSRQWEVYKLFTESIGGVENVPEPDELYAASTDFAHITINDIRKLAAERLLFTLENKDKLEEAFRTCRQALSKEGMIAESSFDELTKYWYASSTKKKSCRKT